MPGEMIPWDGRDPNNWNWWWQDEQFLGPTGFNYEALAEELLSGEHSFQAFERIPELNYRLFGEAFEELGFGSGSADPEFNERYSAAQDWFDSFADRRKQQYDNFWRRQDIQESLLSPPNPLRSSVDFTAKDLGLSSKSPIYINGGTVQPRNAKGQFGDAIGKVGQIVSEPLQEAVRSILTQRYSALGIGKVTGTLFQSLEQAQVLIDQDDEKGFVVHVEPAHLQRDPRENEPGPVPTDLYGSWVYQGRRAIVPTKQNVLRFKVDGHWVITKSVRATGPKDVFDLNDSEKDRLAETAGTAFVQQVMSGIQF